AGSESRRGRRGLSRVILLGWVIVLRWGYNLILRGGIFFTFTTGFTIGGIRLTYLTCVGYLQFSLTGCHCINKDVYFEEKPPIQHRFTPDFSYKATVGWGLDKLELFIYYVDLTGKNLQFLEGAWTSTTFIASVEI